MSSKVSACVLVRVIAGVCLAGAPAAGQAALDSVSVQELTRGQMAVFLAKALGLHWPN